MSLLIAILNHGLAEQSLALRAALSPAAPVVALDSGSALTPEQRAGFDFILPNVFYGGLLAAATAAARSGGYSDVWLWTSDVRAARPAEIVERARPVLARPDTGVYAPSADYSPHPQMRPRRDRTIRAATFADGFCFAARTELLDAIAEEGAGNRYGYGLDIHLGFVARRRGLRTWIDHGVEVSHPRSTGYSPREAKASWKRWRSRMPVRARLFHRLAYQRRLKGDLGMRVLLGLPW